MAASQRDLREVRQGTREYKDVDEALEDGYVLVPGLDHCFNNPGVGAMGYHYIDTEDLDTQLEADHPEAMVYSYDRKGCLRLGAVEYIVPAAAWDAEGHTHLPMLFGRSFHLNQALGVYVLHAWAWKNNPSGVFEDWNPNVSCP